ncbi:glycosyltransferase family 90 protein [Xylaria intraflava]|nr:glycosyltransferase family 90 protein [Xylaria intraflava]
MRLPVFPRRRPFHIVRYVFPLLLLISVLYYISADSDRPPALHRSGPAPDHANAVDQSVIRHPPKSSSPEQPPDNNNLNVQEVIDIKENQAGHSSDGGPGVGSSNKANDRPASADGDSKKPAEWKSAVEEERGKSENLKGGPSGADDDDDAHATPPKRPGSGTVGHQRHHPIDELIRTAEKSFRSILAKESTTLSQAAKAYRERRGRHPPPGFDLWFSFAQENNAIIVEDFFDRIYHDLNPFWGLDPRVIRKEAWDFEMTINIRNHEATAGSDWFWTQIWLKMIKTIEHLLPDMDIALNAMDEPRLVVPWEEVATYMKKAESTRKIVPVDEVVSTFEPLPSPGTDKMPATREKHWEETSPFWLIARRGCPPDSPARRTGIVESYDEPVFSPKWAEPHQFKGFVSNASLSADFCHQPDLQALEGIFIHPLSTRSTRVLYPLFGGSKLATNNEILLPAPMYWNEEERFMGAGNPGPMWKDKIGSLIWRGVATGGLNQESTWQGFQRHRFVAMNNGTKLALAEADLEAPVNFELPAATYDIMASNEKHLGEWVSEWADVGFTDLMCDPEYKVDDGDPCYTDEHFEVVLGQDLAYQFGYKYLPDIDGNSFSGRYLAFLRSTGLPIKSTLWHEWHDSRLIPWKHFVPMDNRFGDYYGIMEYFLGYGKGRPGHDAAAEKIAMDGKAWAESVLRKEDMQIYVLRLLLEYARVSDDRRDKMGWVDDLKSRDDEPR